MGKKTEVCTNCYKTIEETEKTCVFNGKIVCENCDKNLRNANKNVILAKDQKTSTLTQRTTSQSVSNYASTDYSNLLKLLDVICFCVAPTAILGILISFDYIWGKLRTDSEGFLLFCVCVFAILFGIVQVFWRIGNRKANKKKIAP